MFSPIANSLAPVFLIILLGWALRRKEFLSAAAVRDMGRLTYWVGLPCLLFYKIAGADPTLGVAGEVFLVTAGATLMGMVAGYFLAWRLGLPWASMGTFVQGAVRGNLAFVGLPVVFYSLSDLPSGADAATTTALLVFAPMVVLFNIIAVVCLLLSRQRIDGAAVRKVLEELFTNPLLLACVAGGLYSLSNWPLPPMIERCFAAIGRMALPLALLCLGGSLVAIRARDSFSWSLSAALSKVLLIPLIGLGLAKLARLDSTNTQTALIFLACPTAIVSYVLVEQVGGNAPLAAATILISTLLSAFPLAAILVVF